MATTQFADASTAKPQSTTMAIWAYAFVGFLSAFLSFQVQLLLGKYILPWFGGTPAVFATCIFFFQLTLLAGYGYAHFLSRCLGRRAVALLHIAALLAATILIVSRTLHWPSPITPAVDWKSSVGTFPISAVLLVLGISIGPQFFLLSASTPLLQTWFAGVARGRSPYPLYAVSNAGSLLGLVSYPPLIEPFLTLRQQGLLWGIAFAVFVLACAALALFAAFARSGETSPAEDSLQDEGKYRSSDNDSATQQLSPWRRFALCMALAGCASAMLLATTNHITQNVAPVPLLWVLPLTLYLLSFIGCFRAESAYSRNLWSWCLALATVLAAYAFRGSSPRFIFDLIIYLGALLACCMVCHGEVARLKPRPAQLTSFYLSIAAGGVLGSAFVVFVAPQTFRNFFWELHVSLWLCWVLFVVAMAQDKRSWLYSGRPWLLGLASIVICIGLLDMAKGVPGNISNLLLIIVAIGVAFVRAGSVERSLRNAAIKAAIALLLLAVFLPVIAFTRPVAVSRNFYGILTVQKVDEASNAPAYLLKHGRTLHGLQFLSGPARRQPTSYFCEESGIGLVLRKAGARGPLRVGVIGLGVGTLAAYGRAGDSFRFYEINPDVVRMANGYFTFLQDSPAHFDIVTGDARLSMERELRAGAPQHFDVFAIDAFTGDAIPVHLLTREAFATYLAHLDSDGLIAVHISNDSVDLRPVLAGVAQSLKLPAVLIQSSPATPGCRTSSWVLMAKQKELSPFVAAGVALSGIHPTLWTDDFSNLFRSLRR